MLPVGTMDRALSSRRKEVAQLCLKPNLAADLKNVCFVALLVTALFNYICCHGRNLVKTVEL